MVQFSVVISPEQFQRLHREASSRSESISGFVADRLEEFLSTYRPRLSGPGVDEGHGTYSRKIKVNINPYSLEQLDDIITTEGIPRSRFVREFIESIV